MKNIVELAKIITNNNQDAVDGMVALAGGVFCEKYKKWADVMDFEDGDDALEIFAYWLVGYEREKPFIFGAYIDWKEEPAEITSQLSDVAANLGYQLNFSAIEVDNKQATEEFLQHINEKLFKPAGFDLIHLDTGGDCYHLFIIPSSKLGEIKELGDEINFNFEGF